MHILTLDRDGPTLAKGRYICEDINAAVYMVQNTEVAPTLEPFDKTLHRNDGLNILVVGTLGFGDALMLTPVLRQLKANNPESGLELCCNHEVRQVFAGLPYVDGFVDNPLRVETMESRWPVFYLERSTEFNPRAHEQHMTDRFAEHMGFTGDWTENKKPDLILSGDELAWAEATFPRNKGKRRLGVQVQAGLRHRTYPISKLAPELDKMLKDGWEVALLGCPGEFRVRKAAQGDD